MYEMTVTTTLEKLINLDNLYKLCIDSMTYMDETSYTITKNGCHISIATYNKDSFKEFIKTILEENII